MSTSSITIIAGVIGAGKTSLATALAIENMYGEKARERIRACKGELAVMRANGFNVSMPDKHLTYADYLIDYRSPDCGHRRSYDVDGYKLGFATDDFAPQLLPPYSFVVLDEAQKYFNSRKSHQFADNVSRFWEQSRKFHFDILLVVQRIGLIDLNIRELARIIWVEKLRFKYDKYGNLAQCIWTYREWDTYSEYEAGERGKKVTYIFNGNIFKNYDTSEGKQLYMQGLDERDFDYSEHAIYGMSPDDVKAYAERHQQVAPKGFYQEKKGDKKTGSG
ncbi:MAG: zonular occludens toxin domain-containing protein [Firmicutes bacterium]|nr:zonular occludens toxin domain-containing protein [Bacillota bacterium]